MKKVPLIVGLLVVVAMLSGCAAFDSSTGNGRFDHQYDGGNGNSGGHSHH